MHTQPELRKVHLYGALARDIGDVVELAFETPAQALRLLELNWPGFLRRFEKGRFHVAARYGDGRELDLDVERLALGNSADELHVMPRAVGRSKGKGILTAIVGGLIIGAAFFFSGGTMAAALPGIFGATGATYGTLATMGMGLVLSGIGTLLSPMPKTDYGEQSRNAVFNGPINVVDAGHVMPLVFGRMMTGTVVLSASLDTNTAHNSPGGLAGFIAGALVQPRRASVAFANDYDDPVGFDATDLLTGITAAARSNFTLVSINGVAVGTGPQGINVDALSFVANPAPMFSGGVSRDLFTVRWRQGALVPNMGKELTIPIVLRGPNAATYNCSLSANLGRYGMPPDNGK